MTKRNKSIFYSKLEKLWTEDKFLCIGLDSDYPKIPKSINGSVSERLFKFNKAIIDKTADIVLAYKPNSAFYEAYGIEGLKALKKTTEYIIKNYPDILIILDSKRADISSTNLGYIKFAFEELNVDAITIHPYLGKEAVQPFLDQKDKGIIILVKTSNPGSSEFQNLILSNKIPLYLEVAKKIEKNWNTNNNCAVVAGATYPEELKEIRKVVKEMPILIPGIGKQGGDLDKTILAGMDKKNSGMIINSSRDIIFASNGNDFADAARKKAIEMHSRIILARNKK